MRSSLSGGGLLPGFADELVDGFVIGLHAVHAAADLSGRNVTLAEARELGVLAVVLQGLFGEFFSGSVGTTRSSVRSSGLTLGDLFGLDGFLFSHRSSLYKDPPRLTRGGIWEESVPLQNGPREKSFQSEAHPHAADRRSFSSIKRASAGF